MVKFGMTEKTKEKFHAAKKPINIWDVSIDNIVISKLFKTKTNSRYLIGYLDKYIRPFVSIMPEISGFDKTFKAEDKNNKLMSFLINDEKLLEKIKPFGLRMKILKTLN